MKELLLRLLRCLLAPVRMNYARRNGVQSASNRKELPNDVLLGMAREYLERGHSVTINVKGVSMRPFLENQRDMAVLERTSEVKDYDAVLAEIAPGKYVLHRVIKIEGDEITLMGDGNCQGTEHCKLKDVAGVVAAYVRPNRTIQASDARLQRRIRLWRRLKPVRRYLLFIYKALI